MFLKIATIAIVAFIANSEGTKVWDGFSARWTLNVTDGFYQLPQNLSAAQNEGWTGIRGLKVDHGVTALGYRGDPRVVLLFLKPTGDVFGIQVGVPVSDFENAGLPIDYNANPAIQRKTLNGVDYFTGTALFWEDEAQDTRQLWFEINGEFEETPTNLELLASETPFYLKSCLPFMGLHYYRINSTTTCNMFPWFLLRVNEEMIGFGFQLLGVPSSGPERKWFEDIPPNGITLAVPDAPECFGEIQEKYGATSFHVYFKRDPWNINCSDGCTAVYSTDDSVTSSTDEHSRSKRAIGSANVC